MSTVISTTDRRGDVEVSITGNADKFGIKITDIYCGYSICLLDSDGNQLGYVCHITSDGIDLIPNLSDKVKKVTSVSDTGYIQINHLTF